MWSYLGENIGGVGPRDVNLLVSAVGRQFTGYGGVSKWKNDFERCATLFYGLIKNHAFHDANKRTAFLSAIYFLWKIGRVPSAKHRDYERLTIRVAENRLHEYPQYQKYQRFDSPEIYFISHFLKKHTRREDKRVYLLTFHQLNKKLNKFNCRLDNPSGNYIDVVKVERKRRGFWGGDYYNDERRVLKIGFPGWTREVDKKTIHEVLRATGLTPENGFDSAAFFHDAEPLPSLIPTYHRILLRLKDR